MKSVYERLPSPGAGLLQLARMEAGMSQAELAERAGVPRTMVSAYEHGRREPTLPTLLKLLHAAGFELRMRLEPLEDHDQVLAAREANRPAAEQDEWERYQRDRLERLEQEHGPDRNYRAPRRRVP